MALTWDVDPVLFRLAGAPVRAYSLLFAASFLGGYALLRWQLRRWHVDAVALAWFVLWAFATVVVGTRLGHCVFYEPNVCFDPPWRVFDLRSGGLASHGAAALLPVALFVFARRQRLAFGDVMDACSPSVALAACLVRVGNLMNSEILGRATEVPWALRFVRFDGGAVARHPAQLYEAVLAAAVLVLLLAVDRLVSARPRWLLTALLFVGYFGGRLFVELFKDEGRLASWLTTGQVLSLPFVLAGVALLVRLARAAKRDRASHLPPGPRPQPVGGA